VSAIVRAYIGPTTTIAEFAARLGTTKTALTKLVKGGPCTPDMANRLAKEFDSSPDLWLTIQKNFDAAKNR
jgi:addiction module HigA family antidote